MRYTPVRYHLLQVILNDAAGQWTVREMTKRVSARVKVPAGSVQDSLHSMMADNLLEAVPYQVHLTLRLRHDQAKPLDPTATAAQHLSGLLAKWQERHGSRAESLPDLHEGGDEA